MGPELRAKPEIRGDDVGALRGEGSGCRRADAVVGTRHDRDAAVQSVEGVREE
jgi:hypothetical protein